MNQGANLGESSAFGSSLRLIPGALRAMRILRALGTARESVSILRRTDTVGAAAFLYSLIALVDSGPGGRTAPLARRPGGPTTA